MARHSEDRAATGEKIAALFPVFSRSLRSTHESVLEAKDEAKKAATLAGMNDNTESNRADILSFAHGIELASKRAGKYAPALRLYADGLVHYVRHCEYMRALSLMVDAVNTAKKA